ncbi:putative DNA alkylation repair protein [Rhodobacterales bacterium HTCC2150]|nr:putative DNA alkylation repair protein [Rhodobacterales bacterium HTCC2150] [Rhodobacteraceae bacterium HTCC2150]
MEPFKNWISPALVDHMAHHLGNHLPDFDRQSFELPILAELENLELKQRAQLVADHLHLALPSVSNERRDVLVAMLHPDAKGFGESDITGMRGWGIYPMTIVVGQHGLADFDNSLRLLGEMTKRGTSEFDIRPFMIADQKRALTIIGDWVKDENDHVRRLVSEGTRPRLPWGQQLPELIVDPSPMIPILTKLRDDPSEYVRRSVANHLNDITKDHPDLIAKIANEWMKGASNDRKLLLRHACRTLIKQGHQDALAAFGIKPAQISEVVVSVATETVIFGKELNFGTEITSTSEASQTLVIDYVVHFQKANGKLAPKVFKWKTVEIDAGKTIKISKRHPIRPITTRRYYQGTQGICLRINGKDFGWAEFQLNMELAD